MLPLVQVHPTVQTPPRLDPLASLQAHLQPDYLSVHPQHRLSRPPNPFHAAAGSPHRTFPIRSSQPAPTIYQRLATSFTPSHASDHAEHQLRRKTPSGTIDAGYDGSPAGLAAGAPPLKQMILPASSKIYPTAVVHRDAQPPGNMGQMSVVPATGWPYQAINAGAAAGIAGLGSANTPAGGWGLGQDATSPDAAGLDRSALLQAAGGNPFNPAARMQTVFTPSYQQSAGPTAFNPAGFNPPPVWRDTAMSEYRAQVPLSNLGYIPQNVAYDSAYMAAQPMLHHGMPGPPGLGQPRLFGLSMSTSPLDDGFSRPNQSAAMMHSPHRRMESLSLNSTTGPAANMVMGEVSSPHRFKERALAHAHKTYADLLLYLNHTKKAHHGKPASGIRLSSKMVVYPKPPKQPAAATSMSPSQHKPTHSFSQHLAGYSQHSVAQASRLAAESAASGSTGLDGVPPRGTPSTVVAEIFQNPTIGKYPYSAKPHQMHPMGQDISCALMNAKASLEMLSNLCEHSGWKWVDGMLLGGCLHYGLEHYEEALEWFKRIINLDSTCVLSLPPFSPHLPEIPCTVNVMTDLTRVSRHVEAISNIAATLYCLNRHEEAEQHWLQAVKIRPSYLEAVEHLVGLLCSSHRSREAVDTISFVQRALRIQTTRALGAQNSATPADLTSISSSMTLQESTVDRFGLDSSRDGQDRLYHSAEPGHQQPGFGSSGYAIPGNENGRMLLLIHAKGNMQYALKEIDQASDAFEEAVLISAGRGIGNVQGLIRQIQSVLSPRDVTDSSTRSSAQQNLSSPLLLPPERAKHTAQLVFSASNGQLPGLCYIPEGSHRKSAISTTSNSLLSLAKIFQDAMSNGGSSPGLVRQPSGVGDILALYYLSLSLQESPSTANNVGILLASVQQASSQVSAAEVSHAQNLPGIVPGSGLALALSYYNYGLNLDPKHVHLHTNLGSLLKDIGQLDLAIQMYEQAVACDGTFDIALTNLANAVKDRGRINDAIIYYKRAVASNPDFAEAVCGLSTALNSVCDWRGRGGVLLYNGRFDRWHVDDDGMLRDVKQHGRGSGLMKRVVDIVGRQLRDSSTWGCGVLQDGAISTMTAQLRDAGARRTDGSLDVDAVLRKWAGKPWEGSRVLRLIERSTRAAMRNWYRDLHVRGIEAPAGYARPRPPSSLTVPSAPTVLPFHTFTCPLTAKDIRMISQRNALRISCSTLRSPWLPASVYKPPAPPRPHLNIGYVSSDFNNHPLAHL